MGTNFKDLAAYFDAGDFSEEAKAAQPAKDTPGSAGSAEPMDSFTVRLPVSVLEVVRKIAAEENETTGSIIRRMVENAVAEHTSDEATVPVSALRELISLAQDTDQPRKQKPGRTVTRSATTGGKIKVRNYRIGKTGKKKRKVS